MERRLALLRIMDGFAFQKDFPNQRERFLSTSFFQSFYFYHAATSALTFFEYCFPDSEIAYPCADYFLTSHDNMEFVKIFFTKIRL